MNTSDRYPLDFDALHKGDCIPCDQIERIYQVNHRTDLTSFQFKALELSQNIHRERPDLLARVDGYSVRIMTDAEAEEWTYAQTRKAVASIARNARRRAVINRDQFTDEQRRVAESRDRSVTALAIIASKNLAKQRREELLMSTSDEAAE